MTERDLQPADALDPKDRVLIAALKDNARESIVALARRVGLSRSATQDRLNRLEKRGVIRGYTVRLEAGGPQQTRALMALAFKPGFQCEHVLPHLKAYPEIRSCLALAGPTDLMLTVEAPSTAAMEAIRAGIAAIPGIATVSTHFILKAHWTEG
ncbi:Lrp/AsnC family transcriptional regulator [Pedomonas mirosovicensis]|uniref:Lrp/AsnC family transcriptional regulator n=1 Tax=Pedomonas mirosovicensis TaxID=2908641 RepID=UPI002166EE07|nr:Lrp/AsnC family transcriptional regulator [Pedomonas mirosovicensis]MCH8686490.1 Lrp/AsnC family transcriptional regulator [Pedomonas mirosovicensis]